jgi:hypothetical protein
MSTPYTIELEDVEIGDDYYSITATVTKAENFDPETGESTSTKEVVEVVAVSIYEDAQKDWRDLSEDERKVFVEIHKAAIDEKVIDKAHDDWVSAGERRYDR